MTDYLLDTNVVSELTRPVPEARVLDWLARQDGQLFLSVVTIGEITKGIEKARARDAAKAADLERFRDHLLFEYGKQVLPVGIEESIVWGMMMAKGTPSVEDALIAATAITCRLTVATRNLRHFRPLGADVVDPFA